MLTTKEMEKRERIEVKLKKIKYRLFQAEVRFASNDKKGLKDIARKIEIIARNIQREVSRRAAIKRKITGIKRA